MPYNTWDRFSFRRMPTPIGWSADGKRHKFNVFGVIDFRPWRWNNRKRINVGALFSDFLSYTHMPSAKLAHTHTGQTMPLSERLPVVLDVKVHENACAMKKTIRRQRPQQFVRSQTHSQRTAQWTSDDRKCTSHTSFRVRTHTHATKSSLWKKARQ